MQVATKHITVVRADATEAEWAILRQLVAEGLTVVETVTPAMQRCAEALGLNVTPEALPAAAADSGPPKARKGVRKEG